MKYIFKMTPGVCLAGWKVWGSVGVVPGPHRVRLLLRREGRFTWALLCLGGLRFYVDVTRRRAKEEA